LKKCLRHGTIKTPSRMYSAPATANENSQLYIMNPAADKLPETKLPVNLTPKQLRNFWAKVDKNGPIPPHKPELGPCWIWTGSKTKKGYGKFRVGDKNQYAHRISFQIHHGAIDGDGSYHGICSCHACDNPPCVRPEHLFAGTHQVNIEDRNSKGRTSGGNEHGNTVSPEKRARGDTHGSRTHPEAVRRGEANSFAKLSEPQVREIRALHETGNFSQKQIASKFGVNDGLVCRIVNRKIWKHIL